MVPKVSLPHREHHPYALHMARALDEALRESGVKAEWLAHVLGIPTTTLSMYRTGERPLPFYLAALIDEALGDHVMGRELAAMESCELMPASQVRPVSSGLEPLIARHSGALLAAILEARADGVIDQTEREAIHPLIIKLIHELQAEAEIFAPGAQTLRRGA